ncbi:unnamed protein product [Hymenolepis diminuta]|uniref:Uncharacterized protein n=1 Tax=Hymenolepis diminuta TaxID=6216 RepID=A0A564XWL9_HYMDI|nr:unnamed protein product [Hymenolepis diminuta]
MKATEPADVVDVVGDDCEEEDCEESDGATEGDEFVTVAGVAGSDGSAVVFGSALVPLPNVYPYLLSQTAIDHHVTQLAILYNTVLLGAYERQNIG